MPERRPPLQSDSIAAEFARQQREIAALKLENAELKWEVVELKWRVRWLERRAGGSVDRPPEAGS